ncbi:MAG TPA: TetR/AcrR family transcriptional regulator [Acidimicrobiia bacterium]|nr:TetR/AcrR family transcriptional regulator [Acidimicrobiia bacterium]
MVTDGARREEILETAAALFASSGLRTSLREIADACGILPGSLYHHFDSKEAIIVELVERYRDDLDRVAKEALDSLHSLEPEPVEESIIQFGEAIAACAVRHRAALILTLYDPPKVTGDELVELSRETPTAIDGAMLEILGAGGTAGAIRSGIDLELLAERVCQSMLHVGVGAFHSSARARGVPAQKCRIFLHGVAVRPPSKAALDRSSAMRAAREVIAAWNGVTQEDERVAHLRSAARAEFGRRGYEATTMRDISAAAQLSTASVYRMFGSKEDLLASIMHSFVDNVTRGWDAVLESDAPAIERLDALMWVNTNLLDRFSEEFKIQLALLRQTPPTSLNLGRTFAKQQRQMKELLATGTRAGEMRIEGASADARVFSMMELVWMPPSIVQKAGVGPAHALERETVLRGAAKPS